MKHQMSKALFVKGQIVNNLGFTRQEAKQDKLEGRSHILKRWKRAIRLLIKTSG
jgi:hypothetical protein